MDEWKVPDSEARRVERAVVLAAGASSRMGSPKALLMLAGRPLLLHHLEGLAPFADRVVVVLGAESERIFRVVPAGVEILFNPRWAESEPLDSLAVGLEAARSALVTPVDVLPASALSLRALCHALGDAVPVGPDGLAGHPVRIDATTTDRIRSGARPEGGLRTLLSGAEQVAVADPLTAVDFDHPEAWERVRQAFEGG